MNRPDVLQRTSSQLQCRLAQSDIPVTRSYAGEIIAGDAQATMATEFQAR
jgi:hypothetical protein